MPHVVWFVHVYRCVGPGRWQMCRTGVRGDGRCVGPGPGDGLFHSFVLPIVFTNLGIRNFVHTSLCRVTTLVLALIISPQSDHSW